jgi:hypothetical protein
MKSFNRICGGLRHIALRELDCASLAIDAELLLRDDQQPQDCCVFMAFSRYFANNSPANASHSSTVSPKLRSNIYTSNVSVIDCTWSAPCPAGSFAGVVDRPSRAVNFEFGLGCCSQYHVVAHRVSPPAGTCAGEYFPLSSVSSCLWWRRRPVCTPRRCGPQRCGQPAVTAGSSQQEQQLAVSLSLSLSLVQLTRRSLSRDPSPRMSECDGEWARRRPTDHDHETTRQTDRQAGRSGAGIHRRLSSSRSMMRRVRLSVWLVGRSAVLRWSGPVWWTTANCSTVALLHGALQCGAARPLVRSGEARRACGQTARQASQPPRGDARGDPSPVRGNQRTARRQIERVRGSRSS